MTRRRSQCYVWGVRNRRYQLVRVTFRPVGRRIRYDIASPLRCDQMNGPVRNHATYTPDDLVWLRVFRTRAAVNAFVRAGRRLTRVVRLSTLYYDTCDYALYPATFRGPMPRRGQ